MAGENVTSIEAAQSVSGIQPAGSTPHWELFDPKEVEGQERTIVLLGNGAPMMQIPIYHPAEGYPIGSRGVPASHIKQSTTRVEMELEFDHPNRVALTASTPNDRVFSMIHRSLADEHKNYAIGIQQLEQIWAVHSGNPRPDWVSSNDSKFAEAIAKYFDCSAVAYEPTMLLTNGGRDLIHQASFTTGAQPASANYMALTANSAAAVATDTTLTGEIATASGGLIRAQATYAHTAGTNTTTLTKTYTANVNDVLPVTIAKVGIFNASSAGTMVFETLLNSTATLSLAGDNMTATETITGG